MNRLANRVLKFAAVAAMCGFAAVGNAADWTYANNQITEVVTDGATPWVLNTSAATGGLRLGTGVGTAYGNAVASTGSHATIDLRGKVSDAQGNDYVFVEIGIQAFRTRTDFTGLRIPDTIETIAAGAFRDCSGLRFIDPSFPDALVFIGTEAFIGCPNFTNDVVFSNPNLTLGRTPSWEFGLFRKSGISSLDMSKVELEVLPMQVFRECPNLKSVKMPKNMKTFNADFHACGKLADVSFTSFPNTPIPGNVFANSVAMPKGRVTYPTSLKEQWEAWVRSISDFVAWENAGDNANVYLETFNDGTTPIGYATIGGCVKWAVPVVLASEDCTLTVLGDPQKIGAVTPGYLELEKVTTDTLECSAPEYADFNGDLYRCTGYRTGRLVGEEVVWGDPVAELAYTFVKGETGDYYLKWLWEKVACKATIGSFLASAGTVEIAEEPYPGFADYYPVGSTLTVTATAADDSVFDGWTSGAPAGQEKANPLVVTLNAAMTFTPHFICNWFLADDGKSLTDGYWTIPVINGSTRDALVLGPPTARGGETVLDLRRPIRGGGAIVGLAMHFVSSLSYPEIASSLVEARLPETLTDIPGGAFFECTALKSVTISQTTASIGRSAFQGCKALESVTPFLPNTVTSVGISAFRGTSNLKLPLSLKAPGLTNIGVDGETDWMLGQFYESGITSVDLSGSGLTNIGQRTFSDCKQLQTVKLPEALKTIGVAAFYHCSALTTVTPFLPDTVSFIAWAAFNDCGQLRGNLVVRNRKAWLGGKRERGDDFSNGTFYKCGIDSVDISNSRTMTLLPAAILRDCYNLKTVKLPRSLTTFGYDTFCDSYNLMDIQFQSSLDLATVDPPFMGVRMEWRKNAPSCGRLVYPAGDPVWEKYIADEKQAGNFTAWDPESDAAAVYRANFPNDSWTPIGYLRINKDGSPYGQTDKWLVPHNFNVGTMVLVR